MIRTPLDASGIAQKDKRREVELGFAEPTTQMSLNLEYLNADGQWQPGYEVPTRLPRAVKVRVDVADEHRPGQVNFSTTVYLHSDLVLGATP